MHGIPERVEDRGYVEVDPFVMAPDIRHRQRDVFGERARPVDANAHRVGAHVAAPRKAIAAAAAHDVAFAADDIAGEEIGHIGANRLDASDEFVADRHRYVDRLLRPLVPLINVHVRATDPGP